MALPFFGKAYMPFLEVIYEYKGDTVGMLINVLLFPYPVSFSRVLYSWAQVSIGCLGITEALNWKRSQSQLDNV